MPTNRHCAIITRLSSDTSRNAISLVWLGLMLVLATKRLIALFPAPEAEINGDARWTYLPAARKILEDPWAFFTQDINSLYVVPLANLWPALWGADPVRIQLANSVLFLACVCLVWRIGMRLGGLVAAMVASALLASNKSLIIFMPQVLTEPLYVFGFLLAVMGLCEYLLSDVHRRLWLGLAATGLCVTLLSRPVLQVFALAAIVLIAVAMLVQKIRGWTPHPLWQRVLNRSVLAALCLALVLPLATVVKNGVFFQYWGLATGAGAGLHYGLSPYGMGMEPVLGGFPYDSEGVPALAAPEAPVRALHPVFDSVLRQVASSVVRQTSFGDNVDFFATKVKAWLFFSEPEMKISPHLRRLRTFEWLSVAFGLFLIAACGWRRNAHGRLRWHLPVELWPHADARGAMRMVLYGFLLLLTIGMALQFAPVLYNGRYNQGFLEPIMVLLTAVSLSMLWRWTAVHIQSPKRLLPVVLAVILLAALPQALTKYSVKHHTWSMDPLRPGPSEIALAAPQIGEPVASQAQATGPRAWRTTQRPAQLTVPVAWDNASHPLDFMTGVWRFRLSVQPPQDDLKCRNVHIALSRPSPEVLWHMPAPVIHVVPDGSLGLYAIHGNGHLRPAAPGEMTLTFDCPTGTEIRWGGAQLLRITMDHAARELIQSGTPVHPYRADDVR